MMNGVEAPEERKPMKKGWIQYWVKSASASTATNWTGSGSDPSRANPLAGTKRVS